MQLTCLTCLQQTFYKVMALQNAFRAWGTLPGDVLFSLNFFCSSKTDSNTSGSPHGLLKCLGPPLPDMSFCKGKAATLFAKSLFSKTGPSGPLIFAKLLFAKVFFKESFLKQKWQPMAAERNYRLKNVLVYGCTCIYISHLICIYLGRKICTSLFFLDSMYIYIYIYLKLCNMESAKLCHQNGCRTWHAFLQGT